MSRRQKVIIVGGGVAGLTAAHELIERDFDVVVYERRSALGGKAASVRVDPGDPARALPLPNESGRPGEHGFRFFPAWYRHLPDTMRRIPVRGRRNWPGEHTVFDHLVPTESNLLVRYERDDLPIVLHSPKSVNQAQTLVAFVRQLAAIGLPLRDIAFFLGKLATFLRTPEEKRRLEFDAIAWWSWLEVKERSEAFRALTIATTRTLLAAKAEEASAYTIALCAIRTLFDSPLRSDCVLDGPSSEVWIEPWKLYLEARGVTFELDHELESVSFDGTGPRIESLSFLRNSDALYLRQLRAAANHHAVEKAREALESYSLSRADEGRSTETAALRARLFEHEKTLRDACAGRDSLNSSASVTDREEHDRVVRAAEVTIQREIALHMGRMAPERKKDRADFYVFCLPVEQMAYYVNRSTTMTSYAPSLNNVVKLSGAVDWMAGIQFYLRYPLRLAPGHIVCADSEWALTAIEQTQFWRDVDLPSNVQSILSVDVSAWDKKGHVLRKEAFLCTRDEIATEVWNQLEASFNRPGQQEVLTQRALITGQVAGSFYLDQNIVDRFDRKKQAALSQGRDRALLRMQATVSGNDVLLKQAEATPDAPFIFGDRRELNLEPLLVNRPGSLAQRPSPRTPIANMFLAADYVDTATNLACMEGANEAARRAVNEILESSGSKFDRCRLWRLQDGEILPRIAALLSFADRLPGAATSVDAATGAFSALGEVAGRTAETIKQFWKKP